MQGYLSRRVSLIFFLIRLGRIARDGAGEENRTPVSAMARQYSTIEPHPHTFKFNLSNAHRKINSRGRLAPDSPEGPSFTRTVLFNRTVTPSFSARPGLVEYPYLDNYSLLLYNLLTMQKIITITSKRQITIPSRIFQAAGLAEGQKLLVSLIDDQIVINPATELIEDLAGSIIIPDRYKNLSPKALVEKAKKEYFRKV